MLKSLEPAYAPVSFFAAFMHNAHYNPEPPESINGWPHPVLIKSRKLSPANLHVFGLSDRPQFALCKSQVAVCNRLGSRPLSLPVPWPRSPDFLLRPRRPV